ncbi:MAG: CoA transferase [Chloroflexi bacterium]|nr:CoA transferase [Chloroflexota bacterium]
MADEALADVRVLELSQGIAGPFCARLLADYGAEVVKVELSGKGDRTRAMGPFPGDVPHPDKSGLFWYLNSNKKSITLDLRESAGAQRFRELVREVDVVVESRRPGAMARCGLDYETLRRLNPGLVMTSITDFGQDGPYRDYRACHLVLSALGGLLFNSGYPERPPVQPAGWLCHYVVGLVAAAGTLAALYHRNRGGQGQHLDISGMECIVAMAGRLVTEQSITGRQDGRRGSGFQLIRCPDGYIGVNILNFRHWENFCQLIGAPDLAQDPRFETGLGRQRHAAELHQRIYRALEGRSRTELFTQGQESGVPIGLVATPQEIPSFPHHRERGFFVELALAGVGPVVVPGAPFRPSATPWRMSCPAPALGQHNGEFQEGILFSPRVTPAAAAPPPGRLPLEGIRILDCTHWVAGPAATQYLAALGAEVIKVESVQHFDGARTSVDRLEGMAYEQSASYCFRNRNKKGITLNLADPRGRELFRELAKVSDLVTENYPPGVMARFGLTYQDLRPLNPTLVMLSMSGYGVTGPWSQYPAFASTFAQMSGIYHLTGYPDHLPTPLGGGGVDPITGVMGSVAALVGLLCRQRTGRGQHLDFSQLESITALVGDAFLDVGLNGRVPGRKGNRHPRAAPYGCYPCQGEDSWVAIAVFSDGQWRRLCRIMGVPELADREEFATLSARLAHQEELDALVGRWTAQHEGYEVMHLLQAEGIGAGPALSPAQLPKDPHLVARGSFEVVDRAWVGKHPYSRVPIRFSATPIGPSAPAPCLGEHNDLVLRGLLGLGAGEVRELAERRVSGTEPLTLRV